MKSRNIADCCKNAVGTVFLLAGAFFVCSTLLSIRAVFADPIASTAGATVTAQSPRTIAASRRATSNVVSRGTTVTPSANVGRNVSSRTMVTSPRTTTAATSRGVVSRATGTSRTTTTSRNVRARTATSSQARISLQGSAIRGSKKSSPTTYTYLANKLYTGNYSNIIDSTTGLISTDAYNNCMESYYTCMDEICTARNTAQRRCACAGRVKAFAEAETALESANEELIKVSGELALLIANKGKDVSDAFQLTDAEKVMNCVSWQEMSQKYTGGVTKDGNGFDLAVKWCQSHSIYDTSKCNASTSPSYCSDSGNNFGFDIKNIDGSSSDILASLQSWANAKENTLTILTDDTDSLTSAFDALTGIINAQAGFEGALSDSSNLKDSLAQTWGYELFEYAHNNVCNRVLDSCFNGIYEACGTPPSSGRKCGNGASQCPYNYNSYISVSNTGTYELNFITANSGYTASNSATCFGYTSSSGDPYSSLRGPVADARRSIMQKYALDANADCDAYGEQLRKTAQNIGYQKVAAQQALQQKRLEFANEEKTSVLNAAVTASTNFNECISEIYDCYETQARSNSSWTTARIRTYCAQVANVPHCYEEMICNPSTSPFKAVIDKADNTQCKNTVDYTTNTCRNVVTLNDILNGTGKTAAECTFGEDVTCDSAAMRQKCLLDAIGYGTQTNKNVLQTWTKSPSATCPKGTSINGKGSSVPDNPECRCDSADTAWNSETSTCVSNTTGVLTYKQCIANGRTWQKGECIFVATVSADYAGRASIIEVLEGLYWSVTITTRGNGMADVFSVLREVDSEEKCNEDVDDMKGRVEGTIRWNTTKTTYTPGHCR